MAVTPDTSNRVFLREVDEEVRRERIAGFLSRYGIAIVLGLVALLVVVGAGLWWRSHRAAERGVEGERLQAAYDQLAAQDVKGASATLAPLAKDAAPGYRALARMTQADIALRARDARGAARLFGSVAADDGVAAPLRDLALVRQTAAEYDLLKPEVVVTRLRGLAAKGNAFFGSAGEMVALAYLKMNRRNLAATLFGQIAGDDAVPDSVRQRAVQMASVLGTDAAPQGQASAAAAAQRQEKPAS